MSLIGHVYLLAPEKLTALLEHPTSVFEVIDGAYNAPGQGFVDLDKAWNCLHYLLTGTPRGGEGPLSFLLMGGAKVGEEDLGGMGPARVFSAAELAVIADALAPITREQLLLRFDLKRLAALDVYPGRWSEVNLRSDYDLGYYFGPFEELKRVLERGKSEGLGMILWIA
jgi:Domain of unknown function (DUF1877)